MPGSRRSLFGFVTVWVGLIGAWASYQGESARADSPADPPEPTWTAEQREHWSLLPPSRPPVPRVDDSEWVRNPIDAFILAEIEAFGLKPAPEADRVTLIRRLRFDLTGLPPSPEEVDAFEADPRPDAYERLVDRLLAMPQYGERWARSWLDLARFAESDGFKSDKTRPDAWRYRDWVVNALNDDMPYDRFVLLQLAGDEAEPNDPSAFIATGFNRNWPFEDNNKVPGLNRQIMLDDMTDTTASVFLGLTVGCARCHNHKYDPISQRDYYRFQALFAGTEPKDDFSLVSPMEGAVQEFVEADHKARHDDLKHQIEAIEKPYLAVLLKDKLEELPAEVRQAFETDPEERSAFQEDLLKKHAKAMAVPPRMVEAAMSLDDRRLWSDRGRAMKTLLENAPPAIPTASGMTEPGGTTPPVFLLRKGNFQNPGVEVPPGFLSIFGPPSPVPGSCESGPSSGRREALARWLTRPDHPLTARVMVNRLWLNHFGRGIVATPSDFGTQGAEPSHPRLLDWLATEFVARGWSQKTMHRLMVTSATYRQSSFTTARSKAEDPDNILLSRMSRRRLEGEAVRDALLAVSGLLDLRVGGPSVFPDLPPGVETRGGWTRSASAADRNRRSLYVFVRRNLKYPLFDAFDAPDSNVTCPERNVTVNAPQALMLLNSGLILDQARALAGRVLAEVPTSPDPAGLVTHVYRLALGRHPDPVELERGVSFLTEPPAPSDSRNGTIQTRDLPEPTPDGFDSARAASLVDYCHAILNLNEFVFVD